MKYKVGELYLVKGNVLRLANRIPCRSRKTAPSHEIYCKGQLDFGSGNAFCGYLNAEPLYELQSEAANFVQVDDPNRKPVESVTTTYCSGCEELEASKRQAAALKVCIKICPCKACKEGCPDKFDCLEPDGLKCEAYTEALNLPPEEELSKPEKPKCFGTWEPGKGCGIDFDCEDMEECQRLWKSEGEVSKP